MRLTLYFLFKGTRIYTVSVRIYKSVVSNTKGDLAKNVYHKKKLNPLILFPGTQESKASSW